MCVCTPEEDRFLYSCLGGLYYSSLIKFLSLVCLLLGLSHKFWIAVKFVIIFKNSFILHISKHIYGLFYVICQFEVDPGTLSGEAHLD